MRTRVGCDRRLQRRYESAWRRWMWLGTLLGSVVLSPSALAGSSADARTYTLAPGDRISVTVFGQTELSSDQVIDSAGEIMLPLAGPVEVKNLTIPECQNRITSRLEDGILKKPLVSVRISEFRPIYVLGDVRTPGSYPFRFGTNVQSAIALAGGLGFAEQVRQAAMSDVLLADERVRQLTMQKRGLLVRLARLEAQRDDRTTISVPAALRSAGEGDGIAEFVAIEKEALESQARIFQGQLELLRSQKPRIENEMKAVEEEIATEKKKRALVQEEIEVYNPLVAKGLGRRTTQLEYSLGEARHESELWRLTAGLWRLQTMTGDIDVKIQEAQTTFKKQVMADLQDARQRLREIDVALPSAQEFRDVKLRLAAFAGPPSIDITRTHNGTTSVSAGSATTQLEPGDVVDVKTPRRPSALEGDAKSSPTSTELKPWQGPGQLMEAIEPSWPMKAMLARAPIRQVWECRLCGPR